MTDILHSVIPGPIAVEIVLPVTESIGVKLLKKMGRRQGHSIQDSHHQSLHAKKQVHTSGGREYGYSGSRRDNLLDFKWKSIGPAFSIRALEVLDVEDEDVYASGFDFEMSIVEEAEETSRCSLAMSDKPKLTGKDDGVLHDFRLASNAVYLSQRFDPPEIPKDFAPQHKFSQPTEANLALYNPRPPEVPPPDDSYAKLLIDGFATLVAWCGELFDDLSREKHQANSLFDFLNGGSFHEYYVRKVWKEKQKGNQTKPQLERKSQSRQNMTADHHGRIYGESLWKEAKVLSPHPM